MVERVFGCLRHFMGLSVGPRWLRQLTPSFLFYLAETGWTEVGRQPDPALPPVCSPVLVAQVVCVSWLPTARILAKKERKLIFHLFGRYNNESFVTYPHQESTTVDITALMSFQPAPPPPGVGPKHGTASRASSTTFDGQATLERLLNEYKDKFTNEELEMILHVSDPKEVIRNLQVDIPQDDKKSRLAGIASGLERYSSLLAVFGASTPELGNVVWGSLELVRKTSNSISDVKETMHSLLHEFCTLAPRLRTYDAIFDELQGSDSIREALLAVYRSILDFVYESVQWIKEYSKAFRHGPKPHPTQIRQCIKNLTKAKQLLEAELPCASLALHQGWHQEIRDMLATKSTTQPKGILPCHLIPYPSNPRFVGRVHILDEMERCLRVEKSNKSSFALYGIGGIGKTQLALRYIYDHLHEFPAVFWMTADSRAKLSQSYVDAAKQLQIEPEDSQRDPEAVVQTFLSWLRNADQNWIIVFDNADNLDVLKPFWPPTNVGTIIVTSRDPMSRQLTDSSAQVNSMTDEEGIKLFWLILQNSSEPVAEREEEINIIELSAKLGHLPLAISQAANFMVERECTVYDFLEIYDESLKDDHSFEGLDVDSPNLFYEKTLATVWRMSIEKLSHQSTTLLSILSCLDPDGIPDAMIREGTKASHNSNLKFLSNASSYTKTTKELLRNGLIWKRKQHVDTTKQVRKPTQSVALHRLVQETVFHQQPQNDQNKTFAMAAEICLNIFPHPTKTNFRLMQWWPECQQCLPHVLALNSLCTKNPNLIPDGRLAELFLYASWYLYEKRSPELAMPLLETAHNVCEREGADADWFLRSRIMSAFGCVLFECSHYQNSERYFRQALAVRLKNVDPDDILLAHGYQDIALPVSGQGRYQEAIELQEKALEIIKLNCDDFTRRDMTFHVHHNMARTYEASGNAQEALRLHFNQGDEFGSGLRTEMSESGAVNLYAIGNCYLSLGDQDKGIQYHSRALKIRLDLVGDQGFYYGISLHKMGCILLASSQIEEAREAFLEAAEIFRHALDAQRELSRTLYRLSVVERQLGRETDAKEHSTAAWELRRQLTGETHSTEQGNKGDEAVGFDRLVIYIHA
ncbi:hypothetical protein BKA56DRAFT_727761 [Ilyonectria sp. MPI-CAGE-AT-0026]|nr:hypothetical protein BKA56DRAFT_727761 [Ilyonectria sp. MPI-CAGE-AT-0026]